MTEASNTSVMPQTKLLIDFFKVELNFRDEEILYISEIEAK